MSSCLETANYASVLENQIKADFYKSLYFSAQKTNFIRLAGVGIGLTSAILTITTRIALIAESIFKGILIIVKATFHKDVSLKKGFYLLTVDTSLHLIKTPFSLASAILGIALKTWKILLTPEEFTKARWKAHAPNEVISYERELEEKSFNLDLQTANENPLSAVPHRILAEHYAKGKGTEQSDLNAFKCYKKAAHLGDSTAMLKMANYYNQGLKEKPINLEKAYDWAKKASLKGNTEADYLLGTFYLFGNGTKKNLDKAIKYLNNAAQENFAAKYQLALIYLTKDKKNIEEAVFLLRNSVAGGYKAAINPLIAILQVFPEYKNSNDEWLDLMKKAENPNDVVKLQMDFMLLKD